eukprot:ANDGO_02823.mRNA.1 hypothetical protein
MDVSTAQGALAEASVVVADTNDAGVPAAKRRYSRKRPSRTKDEKTAVPSGPPQDITLGEYIKVASGMDRAWIPPSLSSFLGSSGLPVNPTVSLNALAPTLEERDLADRGLGNPGDLASTDLFSGVNEDPRQKNHIEHVREPVSTHDGSCFFVPVKMLQLESLQAVLNEKVWMEKLSGEERNYLKSFLPSQADPEQCAKAVLGGRDVYFGNPRDIFFTKLQQGQYHPFVAREKAAADLAAKADYAYRVRMYHNLMVKSARTSLLGKVPLQYPHVVALADAETDSELSDMDK